MNKLTRKEIGKLIGKPQNHVGILVSRNKLIEYKKERPFTIDIDHPVNRQYLQDNFPKIDLPEIKGIVSYDQINRNPEINLNNVKGVGSLENIDLENISVIELDRIKKKYEISKLDADIKLKNLEFEKKQAKVLPLEFIIDWFVRGTKGTFSETINLVNKTIDGIAGEMNLSTEKKLQYKKAFKEDFNEKILNNIKNQLPEAIDAAKEYALLKW